jgi:hypothetical protein
MTRMTVAYVLDAHNVTRVCHFTPSRNLPHIVRDGELRATKDLAGDVRAVYTATDLERLDGHSDMVCCTIEYPNAYYWNKARAKRSAVLFPTWVVLLIDPSVLLRPGTLFCSGNASRAYGATAAADAAGLLAAYGQMVIGSGGRTFTRSGTHLDPCPTDLQAEVLVPGPIAFSDVMAIVCANASQAATERAILVRLSLPVSNVRWLVAPAMFQPHELAALVHAGRRPSETMWEVPKGELTR